MNAAAAGRSIDAIRWYVLVLVIIDTFMGTMDISIVNVALPTLTSAFHTSVAISQWYLLAYAFVLTVLLLPFGKAADIYGRRRIYIWAITVFTTGSILSGLAISSLWLILARMLQGVGTAITIAAGPAFIAEAFPDQGRGLALGLVGAGTALGLLAGPLVGGVVIHYAGWRWIFFINVPFGLIVLGILLFVIRGFDEPHEGKIDIYGSLFLILTFGPALLGLTYGYDWGWGSTKTIAVFVISALFAVAFVLRELRVREPALDWRLFHNPEFSIGAITSLTNYAGFIPTAVFTPFYLQNVLHYSPDIVGYILASGPITLAVFAPIAGLLSDRIGPWLLTTAGMAIAGIGTLFMLQLTPYSHAFDVVWRLAVVSFGSAIFVSPNSNAVLGSLEGKELATASAIIALMRNLGAVVGVAVSAAIIVSVSHGLSLGGGLTAGPKGEGPEFLQGLKAAWVAASVINFLGAVLCMLRVRPERQQYVRQ